MITLERLELLRSALMARGYGPSIEWTEQIAEAESADAFAERAIYVIANSSMANSVAVLIFDRCMAALRAGRSATEVFGHPGKAPAIDTIWRDRDALFKAYRAADDKVGQLRELPYIGEVTSYHLAKNLGADVAKPDVHLERLARREATTSQALCDRLARESGLRAATIDTILWRACALKVLHSRTYEEHGWDAAFRP